MNAHVNLYQLVVCVPSTDATHTHICKCICVRCGALCPLQFLLDEEARMWQSVPSVFTSLMKYHIRKVE